MRKKNWRNIIEKVDIECVFFFLLNSKTKYIFQTPTMNHIYIIYKAHKFTTSNLNIKIVIAVVTQYKMQAPLPWL